jgi:chitodextrinase
MNTTSAQPMNEEIVDISIIFEDSVDENLLNRMNVEMKYRFQTFAGVSVRMPKAALSHLENNPNIKSWEYNQPVQLYEDSLDWGVDRIDAEIAWGGMEDAVDVSTSTAGSGAKVAVLDTGIDYDHPDLAPIYAGGYDVVNGDNDPKDDHYHGTHCAGTIAAADDEANALSGSLVGTAPSVSLYAVKVLDSQGSGTSDGVAAGIDWAAANGMDVASLSLGSSSPSDVIQTAGENAYAAGVTLIAASGNDGAACGYPAAFPEFIAVGATDQSDLIADFSNYGAELEISAPGVDIKSTTPTYLSGGGPFNPSANYDTLSGTSMATPHVSGVAGLIAAADSSLTNVEIRDILTSTAEDLGDTGWDQYFGYGIVDAEAAINVVDGGSSGDTTPPAQVTGLTTTAVSTSQIDLTWDANSESDLDHYNVYRDGTKIVETVSESYSDTGLTAGTTYTYEVSAVDTSGNEGTLSNSASATTDEETSDTTPPAQVTGLTATAVSTSQIDLAWDANSESDLDHYNIYRDGSKIAETTTESYSDTDLASGTTYTYEVSAVDTSGNEGTLSSSASATTEEDTSTTGTMYVQDIYMWISNTRGPMTDISTRVTVVDGDGVVLSGVTVSLDFEFPDGTVYSYTGTTDSNGEVVFVYEKIRTSGTFTSTVSNLELTGYTYDSTMNVETSETLAI